MGCVDDDRDAIDALMRTYFSSISFARGSRPDLLRIRELFLPSATIIHLGEETAGMPAFFTIDEYINETAALVEFGSLVCFEAKELSQCTQIHGKIANRFMRYENRYDLENPTPSEIGMASFQLVKLGESWRIAMITSSSAPPRSEESGIDVAAYRH